MTEREALLKKVLVLRFAVLDTVLFLDTHPYDKAAITLHNDYAQKYREAVNEYEAKCTMLTASANNPGNTWQWALDPQPWEGGM